MGCSVEGSWPGRTSDTSLSDTLNIFAGALGSGASPVMDVPDELVPMATRARKHKLEGLQDMQGGPCFHTLTDTQTPSEVLLMTCLAEPRHTTHARGADMTLYGCSATCGNIATSFFGASRL